MGNGAWSSQPDCLPLTNSLNASVPHLAVSMNPICLFPIRSLDHALALLSPPETSHGNHEFSLLDDVRYSAVLAVNSEIFVSLLSQCVKSQCKLDGGAHIPHFRS